MEVFYPLLSPGNDFVFKRIFGVAKNAPLLVDLLSSATGLPPEEFSRLRLVDPHLRKEDARDKLAVLDVRVETKSGMSIDIEIQVNNHPWLRERMVYYLSKMVTGQIHEGDNYDKIKKSVIILITDFSFIDDSPDCHNRYQLVNIKNGSVFSEALEINTLELPKMDNDRSLLGSGLREWLMFFRAKTEEEFMLAAQRNPRVGQAVAILKRLSADERTRMLAEEHEKARRDQAAYLKGARMTGRAEGHAAGLQEGEERGLQKGLKKGEMRGLQKGIKKGEARGLQKGATSVVDLLEAGVPLAEIKRRLGL